MKKLLSVFLAFVLLLSLAPAALAAGDEATEAADALYEMGLFNGTGVNADGTPIFELDRAPTRNEAVTMLVRLLGLEAPALAGEWTTPFTDVPEWAEPYVGIAYARGLTDGVAADSFGGSAKVSTSEYITFVLRALGYESGGDFAWDAAWELSDEIGLTNGEYNADTASFTRGDVAVISYNALSCTVKGGDTMLSERIANPLTAYEAEGIATVYMPDSEIYYSEPIEGELTGTSVYVGWEDAAYGLDFYPDASFAAAGYDFPESVEEFAALEDELSFSYDEFGNYAAEFTEGGLAYYMTFYAGDGFFAVQTFAAGEDIMSGLEPGYWISLTEFA